MSNVAQAADALELLREGVSLRREGKDEAALQRFQRAYEIDHGARALAQIGLAEQALGRWALAYEHLTQALAATKDPWVAANGATLRASRDEVSQHVGKLEILGGSPGADVQVDGVVRGQLPLEKPLVLPIGPVTIMIAQSGFVPVQRSALIRAQQMTRESFEPLAPSPQGARVDQAVVAELPPGAQTSRAVDLQARAAPASVAGPTSQPMSTARASAKWIAWGAAVASLGVGVVGYTQQSSAGNQFNGSCYYDQTGAIRVKAGAQGTVDQCGSFSGRVDTWFTAEVVGLIGAGALASLGLVFWLTEPAAGPTGTAALACAPATAGGGTVSLGCRWRF